VNKINFIRRKVDANQPGIVSDLRQAGLGVIPLHTVGKGCPDLVVSSPYRMILVELKTEKGRLTAAQGGFLATWPGVPVLVAENSETILRAFGLIK
jgi:hypothetical protein